jgi:hypothetical protein
MDRFAIIPDDHGEEIRKRVRERDGSDDEKPSKKRLRASTTTLLQPLSNYKAEILEPPPPEDDLNMYDQERLRKGLQYVVSAAKRNITPRTEAFLALHKEALKVALTGQAPSEASRSVVQALDQVYMSTAFFLKPRSTDEHAHLAKYTKLRRLEMLGNYGDYLGQELQEIRLKLKTTAHNSDDLTLRKAYLQLKPPKTWVNIADELAGEDLYGLRKDVYVACGTLGIDAEHVLWIIEEFTERNRMFHCLIRQYIENCQWYKLARQLCIDLKEVLAIAGDQETADNFERVLTFIRDEYFEFTDPDDADMWLPSEKARLLSKDKAEKGKKKASKS